MDDDCRISCFWEGDFTGPWILAKSTLEKIGESFHICPLSHDNSMGKLIYLTIYSRPGPGSILREWGYRTCAALNTGPEGPKAGTPAETVIKSRVVPIMKIPSIS